MAQTRTTTAGPSHRTAGPEPTVEARRTGPTIVGGLLAGAVAGMAMAMWTMIAGGTFRDFGVFTPMYLIAAPFTGVDEVRASLNAAPGDIFWWSTGPALLGAAIHMVNSMMFGLIFAGLARSLRLRGLGALFGGMLFALALMLVNEWITLPLAEAVFGGAPYTTAIAETIGWATWTIGHLMFGTVLGLWVLTRPYDLGQTVTVP